MSADFNPAGDQPKAIKTISDNLKSGLLNQVLLGVTGSGKTYTVAKVIEETQRPAIIMAPNKTLAAQLFGEFKDFFPDNRVEYFISYYDYYQPEAYIPSTDTYIEKDASINDEIDKTSILLLFLILLELSIVSVIINFLIFEFLIFFAASPLKTA